MECNQQRSSSSSDTSDNKTKILLKFKIPKNSSSSAVDEQSGGSADNINNYKRVGLECNKEFESGQALGGHMRIHAQPVKKNSMSADFSVCCSLCGKEFPSMKSLFGHIKCHPERDWRPPPCPSNSSSNFSEEDDMVFDCTEIMPKWPVKGIKRRMDVEDEDDNDDDEEEMRLRDCVSGLMLLKHITDGSDSSGLSTQHHVNGGDQHQEEVTNNAEEEFDDLRLVGNGNFDEQVDDFVPIPVPFMIDESSDHVMEDFIATVGQEGNVAADHVVESHRVEVESHGINTELVLGSVGYQRHFDGINDKDNHGGKFVMGNSKNNKDNKMMGLYQDSPSGVGSSVQVVGASTSTDKYKCSTCDKTFSTHQALGGHRSSHNKFKVTIINGDSSTKKSVSAFAPPVQSHQKQLNTRHDQFYRVPMSDCATKRKIIDEVGGSSKADDISSSVHKCSVCNKIFASGQALGGHKRSHWTAPAADAQTEAQPQPQLELQLAVRSSGEEASTEAGGKRIRLMGFDLHVPASMVDNAA
ncbi:hypothetical protein POM88_025445 [Heracleum sosnowskyi]|uniref:C2H2-type domain-containing protein n=1 Tax=Heracleum sosnowskyi TaxID=360622 RepID=A0AAD8I514_9APIA|nr:hypothetical protein POM88_025445 [Heracleum sosnowskyi]